MSENTNNDYPGLDDKVIEVTFTDSTIDNTHYKMIRIDKWEELEKELKELRHFKDTNTGLWATDQSPEIIINKAIYDGTQSIHWFDDQEERKETGLAVINSIEEEFKKTMFQIK